MFICLECGSSIKPWFASGRCEECYYKTTYHPGFFPVGYGLKKYRSQRVHKIAIKKKFERDFFTKEETKKFRKKFRCFKDWD